MRLVGPLIYHGDILPRVHNWARAVWRDIKSAGPDSSCVNSLYSMGGSDDTNDGWGEIIDGNTVLAETVLVAKAELPEIDDEDAEIMDAWIRQLAREHRIVLHRRYVLHHRIGHSYVDAAIKAIGQAMDANRAVVERMRG